jgi:hypothetical protein
MTDTIRLLGHTFKRMTPNDYRAFADAGPNGYIWSDDTTILVYNADDGQLDELPTEPGAADNCTIWMRQP